MINLNANAKISFFMDTNFPYHDFHGEEQPIENSPINHEECSDDRPLKKDFMSIIEDVNIDENNHLIFSYSNGTTQDAGEISISRVATTCLYTPEGDECVFGIGGATV